jgi:hypothetical protein
MAGWAVGLSGGGPSNLNDGGRFEQKVAKIAKVKAGGREAGFLQEETEEGED